MATNESPAPPSPSAFSLRAMRKRAGLTQVELGRLMGVAGSNVAAWETGKAPVPQARLHSLAAALRVSSSEVVSAVRALAETRTTFDQELREGVRELVLREAAVTNEEIAVTLTVLERIAGLTFDDECDEPTFRRVIGRAKVVCGHAGFVARHLREKSPLPPHLQEANSD